LILPAPLPRIYAICDLDTLQPRRQCPAALVDVWLEAGIRLIQLRAKSLTLGPMLDLANELVDRMHEAGAALIINDRADVAKLSGADGVHVGQDDEPPAVVRGILGPSAIIGLSTHTPEQVARACDQPIDYLAIGPVFATSSKDRPWPTVGLAGVEAAVAHVAGRLPVVAIGGITIDRAGEVLAAGAASVAVISDLLVDPLIDRARAWRQTTDLEF
jgi:thiamine-phosphate pyrophosphorylase